MGWYRSSVALRHHRFALHDVTFAGVSLPGATMDCWDDPDGRRQWLARVVTRVCPEVEDGELSGHIADGRTVSGHALIADQQVGPHGRREILVVFHGAGPLHGF